MHSAGHARQVNGVEHERMSALSFKEVIVGSAPTYPSKFGSKAYQEKQSALNRQN